MFKVKQLVWGGSVLAVLVFLGIGGFFLSSCRAQGVPAAGTLTTNDLAVILSTIESNRVASATDISNGLARLSKLEGEVVKTNDLAAVIGIISSLASSQTGVVAIVKSHGLSLEALNLQVSKVVSRLSTVEVRVSGGESNQAAILKNLSDISDCVLKLHGLATNASTKGGISTTFGTVPQAVPSPTSVNPGSVVPVSSVVPVTVTNFGTFGTGVPFRAGDQTTIVVMPPPQQPSGAGTVAGQIPLAQQQVILPPGRDINGIFVPYQGHRERYDDLAFFQSPVGYRPSLFSLEIGGGIPFGGYRRSCTCGHRHSGDCRRY